MKHAALVLAVAGACHGATAPITTDGSPMPDATAAGDAPGDAAVDATVSPFSFDPPSLDFGWAGNLNTGLPQHIVISAIGTYPQFSLSLAGDETDKLDIIQTSCSSTLSGGGCSMDVIYSPQTPGDHTMTMTASAPGQISASAQIHAFGGTMPHPFGAGLPYLDFGLVTVGDIYGQPVTYKNSGTTTLPAISFNFAGESPDQWQLANDHCTGVQLAPMGTCTVTIVYAPTTLQPGAAVLYATAFDTDEIDLRADPRAASTLSISPTTYDFGTVGPSPSASVPFTITNTGSRTVTGITQSFYSPEYIATSSTCSSLAPGASCEIDVTLAPTATGPDGGSMTVSSSNAQSVTTGFTAIAIPREGVILDTWSHDFGTAENGTTGSNYTFTVTNVGTLAQTVMLSFDDDGASFTIAQDNCSATSLPAGKTCTFEIVFTPAAGSSHFARIHATSANNDAIAHLTGVSTPGDQPLNVGGYYFSNDAIGMIVVQQLSVVHEGGVPKIVTLSLVGPNANEFEMHDDTCTGTTLQVSGDACTVDVWYRPATVGTKLAYLKADWGADSRQGELDAGAFQVSGVFVNGDVNDVDFGNVAVGASASHTIGFKNFGDATSAPVMFQLDGINPGDFSVTNDSCTAVTLAPGDSCAATVVFAPHATGTKHSSLEVAIPGGGDPKLTGVGQ